MRKTTTRKALALAVAAIGVIGVGACHPKPAVKAKDEIVFGGVHVATSEVLDRKVTVVDKLDCPQEQGLLKLTRAAKDGLSCAYRSEKGVVELTLLPGAAGDPKAAVAPIKAGLDAILPEQAKGGTVNVVSERGADGRDRTDVDMPFLHVKDDGERSHVKILGVTINSDTDKAPAKTLSEGPHGVEMVYVLASGKPSPEGYHAVGYVARGGPTGALVVGAFKYVKGTQFNMDYGEDRAYRDSDLDQLIDRNAQKG